MTKISVRNLKERRLGFFDSELKFIMWGRPVHEPVVE